MARLYLHTHMHTHTHACMHMNMHTHIHMHPPNPIVICLAATACGAHLMLVKQLKPVFLCPHTPRAGQGAKVRDVAATHERLTQHLHTKSAVGR